MYVPYCLTTNQPTRIIISSYIQRRSHSIGSHYSQIFTNTITFTHYYHTRVVNIINHQYNPFLPFLFVLLCYVVELIRFPLDFALRQVHDFRNPFDLALIELNLTKCIIVEVDHIIAPFRTS